MKRLFFVFSIFLTALLPGFSQNPTPTFSLETDVNRIDILMTIPDGFQQGWQPPFFGIEAEENDAFAVAEIRFPEDFKEGSYLSGTVKVSVLLNAFEAGTTEVQLMFRYQLCDLQGACFMPSRLPLKATVVLEPQAAAAEFQPHAAAGDRSPFWILLFAFFGGLLLNVMPCVLPVLSLKAFGLLQQAGSQRKQMFINAMLYSAGIICSLLTLAAVTVAVRAGGQSVGWGFQFQSLGYLIFLIVLLVCVSFAMFDVLTIALPGGVRVRGHKNRYAESFLTGILAVLLATPCTAPLLGAAVGFALTKSALMIFAVFFSIGLGLAFPFLLIGIFPASVRFLPKPGNWMNIVKEATGFILCGVTLWLLSVLGAQIGTDALIRFLGWLLLLVLSFRVWKNGVVLGRSPIRRTVAVVLILLLLLSSAFVLFPSQRTEKSATASVFVDYEPFSEAAVSAAIDRRQAVFLVFSADWCLTCRANEKTVLADKKINELFRQNSVRLFYGDYTAGDEAIARFIARYGRAGVPFILFIDENGKETILPELLTKSQIRSLLNQHKESVYE